MSADAAQLAPYRSAVADDVQRLLDGLDFSHAAPLRQAWSNRDADLAAPSICLLTAETLGGDTKAALPLASALALLDASFGVFRDLTLDGESARGSLQADWGMARALNAGDAFFVLAQQSVLRHPTGALDAAASFDGVAARCWRALAAGELATRDLVRGAVTLGTIAAGRGVVDITDDASLEEAIDGLELADGPRLRLLEAVSNALEATQP